uniref:GmrSD restriction endonucleases N-terminal domain-containing protein n=1 Tax=uncultured Desulfobacterium sp. TaxID=201089 RepID=E1YLU8_9BACT|nr:hypothetical protein N47_E45930 [uncultured Desulfobacterium sp.]
MIPFTKADINQRVKTGQFRLLLDGQQRATSLYRAVNGVDNVWIIVRTNDDLQPKTRNKIPADRSLEEILFEVAGKESAERMSIRISDVYKMLKGKIVREKDKATLFAETDYCKSQGIKDVQACDLFEAYLTYTTQLQNLFRAEKLLSYYLLDTDEEKFSLFFERSNSKGIQLNFIDILAAKLYSGFNLRAKVDEFKDENSGYKLERNEIVRAVAFVASDGKDISRQYILSTLNHVHFNEYWDKLCTLYRKCLDYLYGNHFLISQEWLPYNSILIPLVIFLREIPHNDFSQIDQLQSNFLKFWYWSVIFSQRYSSSSQEIILTDAKILRLVAQRDYGFDPKYLRCFQYAITNYEDFFSVSKKNNAIYRGVLNLINYYAKGIRDWKNNDRVSFNSQNLDDHHVFPVKFLRTQLPDIEYSRIDCVLNRTLVPKITNIKIGGRKPSNYLQQLLGDNKDLRSALEAHLIPPELLDGDYDDCYEIFIDDRGKKVMAIINDEILSLRSELEHKMFGIEDQTKHTAS